MKQLKLIGSLAFVLGLFVTMFVGAAYMIYHEPTLPWWLKIAIYFILGGIFVVLVTVVLEQQKLRAAEKKLLPPEAKSPIMIQNTANVPGREVLEVLGLAQGHTIFAIWLGNDLSAMVRLVLGGELIEYTDMMGRARQVALDRMIEQAEKLGADAIVNVRFMTTSVIGSAAELLAYGTAVKLS